MVKLNLSLFSALFISVSGMAIAKVYAEPLLNQVSEIQTVSMSEDVKVEIDTNKQFDVKKAEQDRNRELEIEKNLEKIKKEQEAFKKALEKKQSIDNQVIAHNSVSTKLKKFIIKYNPSVQKSLADKIAVNVVKYGNQANVDPELVVALIARESSFRTNVVSPVGAVGLGQLMGPTARELGVTNSYNPVENIKGTTKYLSQLLKQFGGNVDLSLASYNMGPNAVQRTINKGRSLPGSVAKYVADIKSFKTMI